MADWTVDMIQRIIINPFYTITFASQLTFDHIPSINETIWIQTNASLIQQNGAEIWLTQLLDILEGNSAAEDDPINPFNAINIDSTNAIEHPPLITKEVWIMANVGLIKEMGVNNWLKQLLDVLVGDIVTGDHLGFSEPI
ncbi:hypothetical protein EPA93_22660 [Ktedonosporobacter rubrisoli]|uniref:Uncharacterized protein n=1 Tax=Ktedonosporobacter rubrisoli TaxID=2509675 RepID=A0A4P6JSV3_KTERU|nr:hypothetical protein [Ktedonosporobacter rubrisoli]QBD78639.1 hypothetical protein EPA93_22660 [Ktedonosporobacter rubrisoli]